MAYERDKDRHTRGVGAIAALDHGNAARLRHRALVRRRSNVIDSAKAAYTYQPTGGIGAVEALGRVNLSYTKPIANHYGPAGDLQSSGPVRPPVITGGGSSGGGKTPPPTPKRPPPQPSRLYGGAGTALQNPAKYTGGTSKTDPRGPKTGGFGPVLPLPTPTGAIVTTNPSSGTTTTSGGGGGGTWGAGSGTVQSYPGIEEPAIPDIPDDAEASSPSVDLKTVAIVGGAAVAAYFLFFRKKKGGTP